MRHPFTLIIAAIVCLTAAPALADRGMLQITSDPGGGRVVINGERKGNTPAEVGQSFIIQLARGDYVVEVVKPVDDRSELYGRAEVFVTDDTVQPVKVKLVPLPRMVQIPAGSFLMGSPDSELQRSGDEGPQHRVTIDRPFEMGATEITFGQWDVCVADNGCTYSPKDQGWGRGSRPVTNVSWNDVQEYLRWLNRKTGQRYRLPTEAEWEYAARARTTTPFSTGQTITTSQANFNGECDGCTYSGSAKGSYRRQTMEVGSIRPNAFGLYDVHGNVWEWVEDCWHDSYGGAPSDGTAWKTGECKYRVRRGGSWIQYPWSLRSAARQWSGPDHRVDDIGFRLAKSF